MPRYEYCTITGMDSKGNGPGAVTTCGPAGVTSISVPHSPGALHNWIARLSADGWEMVGAGSISVAAHTLYFKRPIT